MAAEAVASLPSFFPKSPKGCWHVNQSLPQLPHSTGQLLTLACTNVCSWRSAGLFHTLLHSSFGLSTLKGGASVFIHWLLLSASLFLAFLRVSASMRRGNGQLAPLEFLHKLALYCFLVYAHINIDFCQFYYSDSVNKICQCNRALETWIVCFNTNLNSLVR